MMLLTQYLHRVCHRLFSNTNVSLLHILMITLLLYTNHVMSNKTYMNWCNFILLSFVYAFKL